MGLETGWNCHISLTPNGDGHCDGAPSSPSQAGSLHDDLLHGKCVFLPACTLNVTLDHKTSLKSLEYICSNSQKYIEWVKIIEFSFMPKIIRTLSTDHVP